MGVFHKALGVGAAAPQAGCPSSSVQASMPSKGHGCWIDVHYSGLQCLDVGPYMPLVHCGRWAPWLTMPAQLPFCIMFCLPQVHQQWLHGEA